MLKKKEDLDRVVTELVAGFENLFGEQVSHDEAELWLAEYGRRLVGKVMKSLSQRDDIGEPLSYFRAALKSEAERQSSKGRAVARTDTAYETHLKLDSEYVRLDVLTQQEYQERRDAWKAGTALPHNEAIHARLFPDIAEARRKRERELRECCDYWGNVLVSKPKEQGIAEMIAAIPQGAQEMVLGVGVSKPDEDSPF